MVDTLDDYAIATDLGSDINELAWNDDSSLLVTCSEDQTISVYDVSTWGSPVSLDTPTVSATVSGSIKSCAFVPGTDDVMVGCANGKVYLIPAAAYSTNTEEQSFSAQVNSITFRDASTYIVGL